MKHAGKAQVAAFRLILLSLGVVLVTILLGFLAQAFGAFVMALSLVLIAFWVLFSIFTFYFFRDPDAKVPAGTGLIVAPGHGKVDAIGTTTESEFMGGDCQRVSIFLSVLNVHVQNVPVTGKVALCKHTAGQYLNAMSADSAKFNENVLLGFECTDPAREKVGIRLIAGLIARRIIPWVKTGETVSRGERMSLIQFGSRVDVDPSSRAKIKVKLGDIVTGGETVIATFEERTA